MEVIMWPQDGNKICAVKIRMTLNLD